MKRLNRVTILFAALAWELFAQKPDISSMENRVRAIEDRQAILKTLNDYVYLVDFGKEVHAYTDLYTEDAVFQSVPPPPLGSVEPVDLTGRAEKRPATGAVVGRKGIEGWITNEWQVRDRLLAAGHYRTHNMLAPDIVINGDSATSRCYFQTIDNDNGRIYVVSIGIYADKLVRSADGHWRMKERLLIRQGANATNPALPPAAK